MPPSPWLAGTTDVSDTELERLLRVSYVDAGFTTPEIAATAFAAPAVRARGDLLVSTDPVTGGLLGMVIVVPPASPARRLAASDEAEMHLLAVHPEQRARGLGRELVGAAMGRAKELGFARMVLWTQPTMQAAQRLYAACGFVRAEDRDAEITRLSGRAFLVYVSLL